MKTLYPIHCQGQPIHETNINLLHQAANFQGVPNLGSFYMPPLRGTDFGVSPNQCAGSFGILLQVPREHGMVFNIVKL